MDFESIASNTQRRRHFVLRSNKSKQTLAKSSLQSVQEVQILMLAALSVRNSPEESNEGLKLALGGCFGICFGGSSRPGTRPRTFFRGVGYALLEKHVFRGCLQQNH